MEDHHPVVNGYRELTGYVVSIAYRNAQNLTKQGYEWHWYEGFVAGWGKVLTPHNDTYIVFLPGILPEYPEGKCNCPFFQTEHICKHLYFAVEQASRYIKGERSGNTGLIALIPEQGQYKQRNQFNPR